MLFMAVVNCSNVMHAHHTHILGHNSVHNNSRQDMAFSGLDVNTDLGQGFRDNRDLQQYVLTDVTPTGRKLGIGSFGSVEEVSPVLPLSMS